MDWHITFYREAAEGKKDQVNSLLAEIFRFKVHLCHYMLCYTGWAADWLDRVHLGQPPLSQSQGILRLVYTSVTPLSPWRITNVPPWKYKHWSDGWALSPVIQKGAKLMDWRTLWMFTLPQVKGTYKLWVQTKSLYIVTKLITAATRALQTLIIERMSIQLTLGNSFSIYNNYSVFSPITVNVVVLRESAYVHSAHCCSRVSHSKTIGKCFFF